MMSMRTFLYKALYLGSGSYVREVGFVAGYVSSKSRISNDIMDIADEYNVAILYMNIPKMCYERSRVIIAGSKHGTHDFISELMRANSMQKVDGVSIH